MDDLETTNNRIIQINEGVIGPRAPRQKTVKVKTISDFPNVSESHLEVARIYADKKMAGGVTVHRYPPERLPLAEIIHH